MDDGLYTIDISDPGNPAEMDSLFFPNTNIVTIETSGNYAYVSVYNHITKECGMQIIDISDPFDLIKCGIILTGEKIYDAAIDGCYAYFVNIDIGIHVLDISNPLNPLDLGFIESLGDVHYLKITVNGNYAYVLVRNAGIYILDITNPANPFEIGFIENSQTAFNLKINGNYLYLLMPDGLHIIDISNPVHPIPSSICSTDYRIMSLAVKDSFVYITDEKELSIINVSNPSNPVIAGFFPIVYPISVVVKDQYAYVLSEYGMYIIDISDPAEPYEARLIDSSYRNIGKVIVEGHYIYIVKLDKRVEIIDISNPVNPVYAGYITAYAVGVSVSGNYAYVAAYDCGVEIFDISNLAKPVKVGSFEIYGCVFDTDNNNNIIYFTGGSDGLYIIRFVAPNNIQQEAPAAPGEFTLHQNYPNPFNPATTIDYELPKAANVRLVVYDMLGRHIRTLVDSRQQAGHFQTVWDGKDKHNVSVAAGVYICSMEAGDFRKVIKLALIK